ncbi:MAG TPA: hypothetical protein VH062_01915 [Polyangiaceae bacterium]|nr:hypothetical protein [Polyangiaceae bacterium]
METQSTALTTTESAALARPDELTVQEIIARVDKVKEVQKAVMRDGVHFGVVPGISKPSLLKPGAEILGMAFRLAAKFVITETFDGPHLTVKAECNLIHAPTGAFLGQGFGSCSTRESKYAWRKGERVCPDCGKPAIMKSKYGDNGAQPGWFCFAKKDGCNAKFAANDDRITSQIAGRIPNEDVADTYNTVLKMAIKRSHVAAILFVTCASEIFTQDVEDMPREQADDAGDRPQEGARPQDARQQSAPRGQQQKTGQRPNNDASARVSRLIAAYGDAISTEQLQELNNERQELWASLGANDKRTLKSAADGAEQRIRNWDGQGATGTDGKL